MEVYGRWTAREFKLRLAWVLDKMEQETAAITGKPIQHSRLPVNRKAVTQIAKSRWFAFTGAVKK